MINSFAHAHCELWEMAFVNRNSTSKKIAEIQQDKCHSKQVYVRDTARTDRRSKMSRLFSADGLLGLGCHFSPSLPHPTCIKRESHRASSGLWLRLFFVLARKFSLGRRTFLTVYTKQCSCNNWAPASAEAPLVTACRNLFINSSNLPREAYWFWTSADLAPRLQFSFIRAYQKNNQTRKDTGGVFPNSFVATS